MKWLKGLFGGSDSSSESPSSQMVTYKGFDIIAEPVSEGGSYRVGARIEKDVEGARKTHTLIRADTMHSRDDAVEASVNKAKMLIDEQGDRIFS